MIRLYSEPPKNDTHFQRMSSACENWAASYNEVLATQRLNLKHVPADEEGLVPAHSTGYWRFEITTDANTLLADFEVALQSEVSWYRLKYHMCSHDESNPGGCSWDESMTRDYGTVPAGIP